MRHLHHTTLFLAFFLLLALPGTAPCADPSAPPVTVSHAPEVGDGTAFPVTVTGANLESVSLTFLGRSMTATALAAPAGGREAVLLLPVPLDHEKGPAKLTWSAKLADGSAAGGATTVTVVARAYPVQKLTVAPKYVTPDPALKERIDRERKLMGAALTTRSAVRHWNLPMLRPVPGKITSLYGLRRVFNNQPRAPHKGLDFRAAQGDPIAAIADGTVVLTGDFYYAGQFVVVDHGLGVVSISMHMSEIVAQKGQAIKAGDLIGLVGSTGRSTGPHLHLGVSVLGQSIDALTLIALTEEDKAIYAAAIKNADDVPRTKAVKKAGQAKKAKSGKTPGSKTGSKQGKKATAKPAPKAAKPAAGTGAKQEAR